MALELRRYQSKALEAIEAAEREGVRRPLVVHPTGTGKTVTFAHGIKRRATRGRALVMVHREELAAQTRDKLAMIAPELRTGIVKADQNDIWADVVIASVQTAHRDARLSQLVASAVASPFGTIICDEAHHAPAPTWTKVLTGMGAFNPYGPLAIGFTATPERDNGKTLGVWEKVVSYMSIREAIYGNGKRGADGHEGGYLVPILPAVVVETEMDMGRVRKTGGDYSDGDLGREMEESGAIAQIADSYVEHARERKAVAFTPTVATAHALAHALKRRGVAAEALDGGTDGDERKAILRRLKTGETHVVVNCAVLTEGFDEPSISCVIVARPTRFHGLYVQMVGRGTRLHPDKKDLLVLDIVGASNRHELVGVVDLGLDLEDPRKKKDPDEVERQACPSCEEPCDVPEHRCALCHRYLPGRAIAEGEARHENCHSRSGGRVDVFGSSRLRWLPVGPAWVLGAGQEVVVMAPVGLDTWRLATYQNGRVEVLHDEIPADWAMGIGEDRAKAFQKLVERTARWLTQPVSDLQKGRLLREGLPEKALPRVKTRGEAADLLTRIQGRRAVKKLGVSV
jgi:superfamily II DNA or RNA helicase